eukprot:s525_g9.t1
MQRALPKHVPPRAWKSDVSLRNPDAMARHALLAAMLYVLLVFGEAARQEHVKTTEGAVEIWSLPPVGRMAPPLRILSDCELGDDSAPGLEIAADLREAERAISQARERCLCRLSSEVFAPLDQRLHSHEQVREAIRQRQRLGKFATSARLDVAILRKAEAGP